MRKLIMFMVGVTFSFVCLAGGISGSGCQSVDGGADLLTKYNKQIENLDKRSDYYRKKALKEKNKDISGVYSKCADAKQKIADGYKQMLESVSKCRAVCESSPDLKAVICKNSSDDFLFNRKKGKRNSSYIKDMQACIELCSKRAAQFEAAGKNDLSQQYKEFATAMKEKCEGLQMVTEGKKEFSNARKELKNALN